MALVLRLDVQVHSPFDAARLALLTRTLMEYEDRWAQDKIVKEARKYPRQRNPQSRYRRTFRLRGGWRVQRARFEGGDLVVRVMNDTPYRTKVMGDDLGRGQRAVHENWWDTTFDIVGRSEFARGAQIIVDRALHGRAAFSFAVTP